MTVKFPIGTPVIMSPSGIDMYGLQSGGTLGRIERTEGCFEITWENGHHNSYNDRDIILVPRLTPGCVVTSNCCSECVMKGTPRCCGFKDRGSRKVTSVSRPAPGMIGCTAVSFMFVDPRKRKAYGNTWSPQSACPIGMLKTIRMGDETIQLGLFDEFPVDIPKYKISPEPPSPPERKCRHCGGPIPTTQSAYTAILRSGERVLFFDRTTAVNWFRDNDALWLSGGHAAITQEITQEQR